VGTNARGTDGCPDERRVRDTPAGCHDDPVAPQVRPAIHAPECTPLPYCQASILPPYVLLVFLPLLPVHALTPPPISPAASCRYKLAGDKEGQCVHCFRAEVALNKRVVRDAKKNEATAAAGRGGGGAAAAAAGGAAARPAPTSARANVSFMTDATKNALLRSKAAAVKALEKSKARAVNALSDAKKNVIALEHANYTAEQRHAEEKKAQDGIIAQLEAENAACKAGLEARLNVECKELKRDSPESQRLIHMMTKALDEGKLSPDHTVMKLMAQQVEIALSDTGHSIRCVTVLARVFTALLRVRDCAPTGSPTYNSTSYTYAASLSSRTPRRWLPEMIDWATMLYIQGRAVHLKSVETRVESAWFHFSA